MSKTRFIAGLTVLALAVSFAFYGGVKAVNTFGEQKLTKKQTEKLKSVDAKTVLKSVNATDKLSSSLCTGEEEETETAIVVLEKNNVPKVVSGKTDIQETKKVNVKKSSIKKTKKDKKTESNNKKKNKKKNKAKSKKKYKSIGTYKITAYCGCGYCSSGTGITASGTRATEGRTIAADTSVLPMGTKVKINGHVYTVEDRGGAVNGNHIDMYFNSHSEALNWGVKYIEVFVK